MKYLTYSVVVFLLLLGVAPGVWAGPAEEVTAIIQQRLKIFSEGNIDAWMAAYADNAVFHSALNPFRIEGKDAIRAFYTALFQNNPTRAAAPRQLSIRVYGNDTTVVSNQYTQVNFVDQKGQPTNLYLRNTTTWVKMGGQWRIVDAHNSKLP